MTFSRRRRSFKRKQAEGRTESPGPETAAKPSSTGAEAAFFRSSIDSHAIVTVVLRNGERLRGRIRYFDRDCFSVGLSPRGPNLFIRKSSVLYISEE